MSESNFILADGRWSGPHGIGRFSTEVISRLQHTDVITNGPKPLSLKNLFWLPNELRKRKNAYKVFFSPGFNPVAISPLPYVFTICDLIHLHFPGAHKLAKKMYYEFFIKPRAKRANKIITISEYSKNSIIEWAGIPEENVINVSCGVSSHLSPEGIKHSPGYPYLLHIGNMKPHKNVERLIEAFATAKISEKIRLVLTGKLTPSVRATIAKHELDKRIVISDTLTETQLAEYYRGALAVVFPSLYEGFGLPPLEAMACGTAALTSNTTSLPEVVGDAALIVDPYSVSAIAYGIELIVQDEELRKNLITKGFERAKLFTWENTANKVQQALNELSAK